MSDRDRGHRFADWLNNQMEKKNITTYKLAKDIGRSPTIVKHWRKGEVFPQYSLELLQNYFRIRFFETDKEDHPILPPISQNISRPVFDPEDLRSLMPACLQAAGTLLAGLATHGMNTGSASAYSLDNAPERCAGLAKRLFHEVTGEQWPI